MNGNGKITQSFLPFQESFDINKSFPAARLETRIQEFVIPRSVVPVLLSGTATIILLYWLRKQKMEIEFVDLNEWKRKIINADRLSVKRLFQTVWWCETVFAIHPSISEKTVRLNDSFLLMYRFLNDFLAPWFSGSFGKNLRVFQTQGLV